MDKILSSLTNESDKSQIFGWTMYAALLINRFEKVQRNIMGIMTGMQQGRDNSYTLVPGQFEYQLTITN